MRTIMPIIVGIHIGANIHSHDHVITFPSFNPINKIVKAPKKPIPPTLEFLSFIVSLFLMQRHI